MTDDFYFMGLALEQAKIAFEAEEVPVGAVLVDSEGNVIASAYNLPVASSDPTAHAEILAIRAASARLGNYRLPQTCLYVTLEPCPMCVGAMLHARIQRLVFGAKDPKSGAAGSVIDLTRAGSFNHSIEVTGDIRSDECAEILRAFFRNRRSTGIRGDG